jgi:hypothetical protein
MGNQYNTLAHVLLVVHDPTIPQIGPSHKQSRQIVDVCIPILYFGHLLITKSQRTVQEDVRTLCGVALSNSKIFPCKFVACYAIALVGDRFSNRADQERLHNMLLDTEREHGFPPTTIKHQLEEAWGWPND